MTRARVGIALALNLALAAAAAGDAAATAGLAAEGSTGRLLVSLRVPEVPPPAELGGAAAAEDRERRLDMAHEAIAKLTDRHRLRVQRRIALGGALVVEPGGRSLEALEQELERDPLVLDARPEQRMELRYVPDDFAFSATDPNAPGNDFAQWNLRRQGAIRAWNFSRGGGARVAVIDTGADVAHPDLSGNLAGTLDCAPDPCEPGGSVSDVVGHGAHTAGLACADTDDGYGIASLGFNCRLDVIRLDASLSYGSIVDAIYGATNRGADVINMSFGGGGPDSELIDAMQYALDARVVLVAAGSNTPIPGTNNYPATWIQREGSGPNIDAGRGLVVTMAKHNGTRHVRGQKTSGVSVAAFGAARDSGCGQSNPQCVSGGQQGILSTWPPAIPPPQNETLLVRTTVNGDNRYAYLVGTSMAAPQVAGLAALIRNLRPQMSAEKVARIIKLTADGRGEYGRGLGWGIIDAHAALAAVLSRDITAPISRLRRPRRVRGAKVTRKGVLVRLRLRRYDPVRELMPTSGVRSVSILLSVDGGRYRRVRKTVRRAVLLRLRPGHEYRAYSRAVDRAGNREGVPRAADVVLELAG